MSFLCQNHNLITCLLRKMHFEVQIAIFWNQTKYLNAICWVYGLNPPLLTA